MFGRLNTQQKYFKAKLDGVQKTIWDLEFKRFKTREIREEIRVEYDGMKGRVATLDAQLVETLDKKVKADLQAQRDEAESTANRYLGQMKGLDIGVGGSGPSEDYPDGVQGINQQLEALHELEQMINDYVKVI